MKYTKDEWGAICLIVLFTLICFLAVLQYKPLREEQIVPLRPDTIIISGYYYENMIDTIKKYEGFCPETCFCLSEDPYIGYGHRNWEGLTRVSETQADSILRCDLDYAILRAHQIAGVSGNRALACAGMIYCMGQGAFANSTICEMIINKENIDHMWEKYGNINGEPNKRLRKRLDYSKKLYNEK